MQPTMSAVHAFFSTMLTQAPVLLVGVVGACFSLGQLWRDHRSAAVWALTGFVTLALHALTTPTLFALAVASRRSAVGLAERANMLAHFSLYAYVLFVVSIVCLGVAVFSGRYQDYRRRDAF